MNNMTQGKRTSRNKGMSILKQETVEEKGISSPRKMGFGLSGQWACSLIQGDRWRLLERRAGWSHMAEGEQERLESMWMD